MNRKYTRWIGIMALAFALALGGCGGGGTTSPDNTGTGGSDTGITPGTTGTTTTP